jgi:hypothetical protein
MLSYHVKVTRRIAAAAIGGVLLLAFAAGCAREDQNALVVFGPDSVVVVAPLSQPGGASEPMGQARITFFEVLGFDLANPDAFGRATSAWGEGYGGGSTFLFNGMSRNSNDPHRLPAIGGLGTETIDPGFASGGCVVGDASYGGGNHIDMWCGMMNFAASTDYTMVYVRHALDIRGDQDTPELLIFGSVAAPDSLYPLDGTPSGYPASLCNYDFGTPAATTGVTGTQNPFTIGYLGSSPTGTIGWDCLVEYGGFWTHFSSGAAGSPFAPNTLESFALPRYNYVEVYEGLGIPPATQVPVLRIQVGVDLDATGTVIPNSYAPFPLVGLGSAVGEADAALSAPDSVEFDFEAMAELTDGVYTLWAIDDGGTSTNLEFQYRSFDGVDTITAPTVTRSFAGDVDLVHRLTVEYPGDTSTINQFFLTIESTPFSPSPTPNATQPLWVEDPTPGVFRPGETKPASGLPPIIFGTFDLGDMEQRYWSISGVGSGGAFGEELRYGYGQLPRAPVGYQYVGWLASGDTTFVRLPDSSFTTPPPEYTELTDSDTDLTLSDFVQPQMLLEAFTRLCSVERTGCAGPYNPDNFDTFILTLEPKAAGDTEPSATGVLSGVTPVF